MSDRMVEVSTVELSMSIKALQLAARWEARQGDERMAAAFTAMRAQLWEKYRAVYRSPLSTDDADRLGLDPGGRFADEPQAWEAVAMPDGSPLVLPVEGEG